MDVRTARPADLPAAMNVLDGASLSVDAETVRARIDAETVFVAVTDGRVLGACVLTGREIEALAS